MSESVSRKNFLNLLDGVDYYKFGNISADWESINSECERFVEHYPDYWCSLVPDESFEVWDDNGKEYLKSIQQHANGDIPVRTLGLGKLQVVLQYWR